LHRVDARHDERQRLLAEGERQEVVRVAAARHAPAEVLRDKRRLEAPHQGRELCQVALVQRVRRSERHAHAVEAERPRGREALEPRERGAAGEEVVLAVDLEESQRGARIEDRRVVRRPQPDADGARRDRGRHGGRRYFGLLVPGPDGLAWPPRFAHVPFGTYFHSSGALSRVALPAQVWRAVPQSFWPALAMP